METKSASVGGASASSVYTRYVYDSENHLRYAISAEGYVTEYRYTTPGELQATIEYPQHVYASGSTAPSLSTMDAWRDGLSDRSTSKLTEYAYDARGGLTQTTQYGVATSGGASATSEGYSQKSFIYDQSGALLQTQVASQAAETFVYDGLGRLIGSTDLNGGATSIVFNDASLTTVVTTSTGLTTTSSYNKAGELISKTESGANTFVGTSAYLYDKNGQLRRATDATGLKRYFLYDKSGRKIADIGHNGQLIEYRYDAAGRLAATGRFQNLVSSTNLTTLDSPISEVEIAAIRPTGNASDIWQWSVYDAAGRVIESIQGDGAATSYEYDAAGRLVKTLSYFNRLTAAQRDALVTTPPTATLLPSAHANDVVIRTFYDADGRVIGALNGEGGLSQIFYDAAGQKIRELAYANPTSTTYRASGTFAQLLGSLTPDANKDVSLRYVYDGQGLLRFTIDGLNRVSELIYRTDTAAYATGLVRKTAAYAAALGSVSDYKYATIKTAVAALASSSNDRVSYNVYNDKAQLAYAVDAAGAVTGFAYDSEGRVARSIQFATLVDMSTKGADAQWKANLDSWASSNATGARITRNYYSARGDLRYRIDAEGYVTVYEQDAEARIAKEYRMAVQVSATDSWAISDVQTAIAGSASALTQYAYDGLGRLESIWDPNGVRRFMGYHGNGRLAWDIAALGAADESQTRFFYDQAGRKTQDVHAYSGAEQATTSYAYDALGNLASVTDARGNVATYTYDKAGRVLTATNALSGVTTYEYDALGRGVKVTDARGNANYNYFDALGRVTLAIDAEGYATHTAYTAFGEVYTVTRRAMATTGATVSTPPSITTNSADATTTFVYDKLGRVYQAIDALGNYEQFTVDAFGDRVGVRNKLAGWTTQVFDKRGLLTAETLPVNSVNASGTVVATSVTNKYEYDSRGNRTKMIEAFGLPEQRTTTYAYDAADRLISKTGDALTIAASGVAATSSVTPVESYYYDRRGNLIESRDAVGARTLYWYDKLDRVTHKLSPLGALTQNFYDANGNLTKSYAYATQVSLPADATGAAPAGSGAYRETQYAYDALNRLTQTKTPSIQTALYTTSLAVTTQDLVTSYEYDANGNVVRVTDPNGKQSYSYYDKLGRKTAQIDAELYRTNWSYDANGNVLSELRFATKSSAPSGVTAPPSNPSTSTSDRQTNFAYDKMGRRTSETRLSVLVHNASSVGNHTTVNAVIAYQYNGLGEVTRKTEATGDYIDYAYDVGGRMTSEQRSAYTDYAGASVSPRIEYLYNGLNALSRTRQGGATAADSDRVTTYTYGAGGRLASMTEAAGASDGTTNFVRSYFYDAVGRLTRQQFNRFSPTDAADEALVTDYDLEGHITKQGSALYQSSAWTRSPSSVDTAVMRYNAYGEVSERGVNIFNTDPYQEKFEYDAAGRLWRTNSGDGVWKYFLHDAAGNQTLAIKSTGANIDAQSLTAVLDLWGANRANIGANFVSGVVATITKYDGRNQGVEVREPQRELSASAKSDLVTTRSYNAFGEAAYEINPLSARFDYSYNTMGRLIKVESPSVQGVGENGKYITGYSGYAPDASSTTAVTFRPVEHKYYDVSGRLVASRDAKWQSHAANLVGRNRLWRQRGAGHRSVRRR